MRTTGVELCVCMFLLGTFFDGFHSACLERCLGTRFSIRCQFCVSPTLFVRDKYLINNRRFRDSAHRFPRACCLSLDLYCCWQWQKVHYFLQCCRCMIGQPTRAFGLYFCAAGPQASRSPGIFVWHFNEVTVSAVS